MRKFKDINVTEKEWKYIKAQYRQFNKKENRSCNCCPMEWEHEPNEYHVSPINLRIWNKLYPDKDNKVNAPCICHQFPEFKKASTEFDCPCHVYSEGVAFGQLQKLINRWEEENE